jgi:Tfp pilus assembly protein PilE
MIQRFLKWYYQYRFNYLQGCAAVEAELAQQARLHERHYRRQAASVAAKAAAQDLALSDTH